jgi:hypothetical protein
VAGAQVTVRPLLPLDGEPKSSSHARVHALRVVGAGTVRVGTQPTRERREETTPHTYGYGRATIPAQKPVLLLLRTVARDMLHDSSAKATTTTYSWHVTCSTIPAQKPVLLLRTVGTSHGWSMDPSLHASPGHVQPYLHSRGYQRSFVFMRQTRACTLDTTTCMVDPAGGERCNYRRQRARAACDGDVNQKQYACHSRRAREIAGTAGQHAAGGAPLLCCCVAVRRRPLLYAAVSSLDFDRASLPSRTRPYHYSPLKQHNSLLLPPFINLGCFRPNFFVHESLTHLKPGSPRGSHLFTAPPKSTCLVILSLPHPPVPSPSVRIPIASMAQGGEEQHGGCGSASAPSSPSHPHQRGSIGAAARCGWMQVTSMGATALTMVG